MVTPGEHVEIHGGIAYHVDTRIIRQVPLAQLHSQLAVPQEWTLPTLPRGTRLVHVDPPRNTIDLVVEEEFAIRTFNTTGMRQPLRLMIPNAIYVFSAERHGTDTQWHIGSVYAFWAKERITGWEHPVIDMMLPNVYEGGRICFGTTGSTGGRQMYERVDETVNNFFHTDFNRDLGWRKPSHYRSYAQWARDSRDNPMAWLDWPDWTRARPLNQWINPALTAPVTTLEGEIPTATPGWTFGRAAEWFETLRPTDRMRLVNGIRLALPRVGMEAELDFEDEDLAAFEATARAVRAPARAPAPVEILEDEDNLRNIRFGVVEGATEDWPCACTRCHCPEFIPTEGERCESCHSGNHVGDPRY